MVLSPNLCRRHAAGGRLAVGLQRPIALTLVWPRQARRTSRLVIEVCGVLSASSVLSIASAASLLSIGSFASVLSVEQSQRGVGSDGGFLSIGRSRRTSMPED